jgi:exodeoxyribonuclease VII large subunit
MSDADTSSPPTADLDSDDVMTVDTLNGEIAAVIEESVALQHDYVVGDVSDCGEANGNVHFDLVANDASIHCVLLGYQREETAATPEDGMRVAVSGDLSYYEAQGSCSIFVTDVVEMGESEYSQVYEQNRERLAADGLLAEEHKQALPELPGSVGIVTSADSDARTDAVTAIHDRYPDVDIVVADATVQGEDALRELLSAVSALDADTGVDVIVVTRGGGADKTLRVFDETPLCRIIADTDTPVVVAVGHENDRVLAGDVADRRVMTPTHVGAIVPERDDLQDEIDRLRESLDTAYTAAVETRLTAFATALDNAYRTTVTTRLQDLAAGLTHAAQRRAETRLTDLATRLDRAYHDLEREKEHERELEATAEDVRAEVRADIEATQRRYRIALTVLVALVLALALLYFL